MITLAVNTGKAADILQHLQSCDESFVPPLSSRVDLQDYTRKIVGNAARFEAWSDDIIVGLVALYCNAPDRQVAYLSNVSVLPHAMGQGLGKRLMQEAIVHASRLDFDQMALEVSPGSAAAIALYRGLGFQDSGPERMTLPLDKGAD
jgi:ribosomal-protein-alanine N-acetyltransferase